MDVSSHLPTSFCDAPQSVFVTRITAPSDFRVEIQMEALVHGTALSVNMYQNESINNDWRELYSDIRGHAVSESLNVLEKRMTPNSLVAAFLAYSSTLKMETVFSSQTSGEVLPDYTMLHPIFIGTVVRTPNRT